MIYRFERPSTARSGWSSPTVLLRRFHFDRPTERAVYRGKSVGLGQGPQ
jgi:hypothetical protein